MRTGVTVYLSPDRKRLQAIVDDRNSPGSMRCPDCAGDGRRAGHCEDAHRWRQHGGRLALARAFMSGVLMACYATRRGRRGSPD
jgi:hypothetical protein